MPKVLNYDAQVALRNFWGLHKNFAENGWAAKVLEMHDNFRESCEWLLKQGDSMQTFGDEAHKTILSDYPWIAISVECHNSCEERRHARLNHVNSEKQKVLKQQRVDFAHRIHAVNAVLQATPKTQQQREAFVRDLKHEIMGWAIAFKNHLQVEEQEMVPLFLDMGQSHQALAMVW